jgi:hypothetical protein
MRVWTSAACPAATRVRFRTARVRDRLHNLALGSWMMPKGFDLKCGAGKTARVWLQGKGGDLTPGQALVLLLPKPNEDQNSPAAYLSPLRTALIDRNDGHVNIVVCESDYLALKRGIENLPPGIQ